MSLSLNTPTPTVTSDKIPCPAGVPEKFWDDGAGSVRLDDLIKSYCELEKRFMTRAPGPSPTSVDNLGDDNNKTYPQDGSFDIDPAAFTDPKIRDLILKHLGRPDRPDDYVIAGMDPYITLDPDLNARLHDLGFTQNQVQAVYDLAIERLVPLILVLATDQKAEQDINHLITKFGGPKRWAETARQIQAYGQKHLPADLLETLAATPEGIFMLHEMMQAHLGAHTIPSGAGTSSNTADMSLERIRKMMRDPRYWRDHDPKFVEKVSAGFARLYG